MRSDWPAGEGAVGAVGTEGVDEGVDVSASGDVAVGAIVTEVEGEVASPAVRVGGRAIFAVGEAGAAVGTGVGLR